MNSSAASLTRSTASEETVGMSCGKHFSMFKEGGNGIDNLNTWSALIIIITLDLVNLGGFWACLSNGLVAEPSTIVAFTSRWPSSSHCPNSSCKHSSSSDPSESKSSSMPSSSSGQSKFHGTSRTCSVSNSLNDLQTRLRYKQTNSKTARDSSVRWQ